MQLNTRLNAVMNSMSLKQKILLFLIPLLFILTVSSGYQMFLNFKVWKQSEGLNVSVDYLSAISKVVHNIQNERGASVQYITKAATKEELEKQRNSLNEALKELNNLIPL